MGNWSVFPVNSIILFGGFLPSTPREDGGLHRCLDLIARGSETTQGAFVSLDHIWYRVFCICGDPFEGQQ